MRKYALLALAAIALLGTNLPASAEEQDGIKFNVTGEIRSRFDYWDNAIDLNDDNKDGFSVWPYRVRVGVDGMLTEKLFAHVEFQNFGTFGNEWPDKGFGFEDSSGSGDDVQLYQAYLDLRDLGGSGMDLRIGRQEMPYGTELLVGDSDFYNGVSFDGLRAMRLSEKYDFNVFYFKLFEGNNTFATGSDDDNLFGATFDWKLKKMGSVGGYWLAAQILDFDSKVNTVGARWNKMPSAESAFDWNLEYAIQTGDFNEPSFGPAVDLSSDVLEGWFGFSFGDSFRNRIRVGILQASGDSDPFDDEEEAFFALFGDPHQDGRLGDLDFYIPSDIENINLAWTGTFKEGRHAFGVAFHDFKVAEDFGGNDDLGTEIDLTYDWMPNKVLGFQVGYGELSGADALLTGVARASLAPAGELLLEADTVTRFWAQVRARW